ncbi:Hypothetical protein NTJ_11595 [Nesidiocoris tenuis]|uniref:Uncharacterized protein n=1 Tax=Nesidiocoris tenuis TaxID=355587 RepID=A0ABN7B310_9HEMI|nr:Hypothetical protein NTJ_11595 [Nesidiocoris tenuis]
MSLARVDAFLSAQFSVSAQKSRRRRWERSHLEGFRGKCSVKSRHFPGWPAWNVRVKRPLRLRFVSTECGLAGDAIAKTGKFTE